MVEGEGRMCGKTNTKSVTNITDAHTHRLIYKHTFVKLHEEKKIKREREREKDFNPGYCFALQPFGDGKKEGR